MAEIERFSIGNLDGSCPDLSVSKREVSHLTVDYVTHPKKTSMYWYGMTVTGCYQLSTIALSERTNEASPV